MKLLTALLASALLLGATAPIYSAQGAAGSPAAKRHFNKTHPRRHQVNKRLKRQNKRITAKEKSGKMTQAQGKALRQNDKNMRGEERAMAAQNNGHITKQEQGSLNQQENANSQAIKNE